MQPAAQGAGDLAAVHRLALFDAYGSVTNIVSQLDILRQLPVPALKSALGRGPLGVLTAMYTPAR